MLIPAKAPSAVPVAMVVPKKIMPVVAIAVVPSVTPIAPNPPIIAGMAIGATATAAPTLTAKPTPVRTVVYQGNEFSSRVLFRIKKILKNY
jgi:hypothetical protein